MRWIKRKMIADSWDFWEHEGWFLDITKEGLHLRKVNWFFAHFEQGEPKDTQYRIHTSSNKNMSAADKEMFQEVGWYHVTKLGEFNVFSSPIELQAPELHTDPVEQAYMIVYNYDGVFDTMEGETLEKVFKIVKSSKKKGNCIKDKISRIQLRCLSMKKIRYENGKKLSIHLGSLSLTAYES